MNNEWKRILRQVAPGRSLRAGLDSILHARTGGLIVFGHEALSGLMNSGFNVDCSFSPARLYELAKMDGAIVLSADGSRIVYANVQLEPDPSIPSFETGIRHRTAERIARQTGCLVIAVSERRQVITLYKNEAKYILQDISSLLAKASQALQTLERYRKAMDHELINLSALEFENVVTVADVCSVLQRIEIVLRVAEELEMVVLELGDEGRLVNLQMQELLEGVAREQRLLVEDYLRPYPERPEDQRLEKFREKLTEETPGTVVELSLIARLLGYGSGTDALETAAFPRGLRLLGKIPRLPYHVARNLVARFHSLQNLLGASVEELDAVEGIGTVRANAIRVGLRRLREQVMLNRRF